MVVDFPNFKANRYYVCVGIHYSRIKIEILMAAKYVLKTYYVA